jgi:predicted amidohydrolase YtcJ
MEEKGRFQAGRLTDLTILWAVVTQEDTDLLNTEVLYTIVDGEIVGERE